MNSMNPKKNHQLSESLAGTQGRPSCLCHRLVWIYIYICLDMRWHVVGGVAGNTIRGPDSKGVS